MTAPHAVLKNSILPAVADGPELADRCAISPVTARRPSQNASGAGRITGLALIAVLTLALGYLHFAGSSTAVSVPAGAHAGQLTLKSCTYNTEKGAYAADCGTLVVPENRHDPHSRLIALPVISDPCPFGPSGRPDLPPARRPRHHQHGRSRTRAGSPPTTTSCSSATAASTAPSGSTARR